MGRRSKIFISYRRDDASDAAGRVYDRLAQKFGAKRIFMDVDSIQRGHDFREVLERHLAETAVLLVLIGRQWLDLAGPDGTRRLDDPSDFVRLEIATALRDKIPVIPVLLNDATMPTASVLPDDIAGLAFRQASKLRHESFRTDILDPQAAVKEALAEAGDAAGGRFRTLTRIIGAVGLVSTAVTLYFGYFQYQDYARQSDEAARRAEATQRSIEAEARRIEAAARAEATRPATFSDRLQALPQGESLKECDACPEMVAIPGGSFAMGSPESEPGRQSDEGPQRRVTIQPFAIGKFEVTFAEWDACVAGGGCGGYRPKDEGWGRGRRPVINVSWEDAQAYVSWLNSKVEGSPYRLPSEAEWEYAARAGSSATWSFGDRDSALGAHAWFRGNSGGKTHKVGGKRSNAFGLHDVHGNVMEWVEDCWNRSNSGAPTDGSAWKKGDCSSAVLRGGSWPMIPLGLRSAFRFEYRHDLRDESSVGFRVVRTHRGRP